MMLGGLCFLARNIRTLTVADIGISYLNAFDNVGVVENVYVVKWKKNNRKDV